MTEATYSEDVVQAILAKCETDGPPETWRDLPHGVLHRMTRHDVEEATRRVKQRTAALKGEGTNG